MNNFVASSSAIGTLAVAVNSGYALEPALVFADGVADPVVERPGTACITTAELNQVMNPGPCAGHQGRPPCA